jgi:hypothetical protein
MLRVAPIVASEGIKSLDRRASPSSRREGKDTKCALESSKRRYRRIWVLFERVLKVTRRTNPLHGQCIKKISFMAAICVAFPSTVQLRRKYSFATQTKTQREGTTGLNNDCY